MTTTYGLVVSIEVMEYSMDMIAAVVNLVGWNANWSVKERWVEDGEVQDIRSDE